MSIDIEQIVARILAELRQEGMTPTAAESSSAASVIKRDGGELVIDLADPTEDGPRHAMGVDNPYDADALRNLMATTSARLGVGRAGPRPKTGTALLFQADHGVTQDAIYGVVSEEVRDHFNLFTVTSKVADRAEFLLRPDLGRLLSDESKKVIAERCTKSPDVQLCVVDGLSAAAIDNNLRDIYPVIEQGLKSAGLSVGTPFFIENGRVGIMNDINSIVKAKVIVLLIGERPGLGIADAMSAYMGYDPQPGKSDADRDLICMITTHGGTNPLEAGAYIVEFIKRMINYSASGVKLREVAGD
ncbi:ethanolamine ammonia-lyase subunit EutC [Tessaracoccus defluvii]|uniref:Ethanolamine ammonia-lyase small subunit n=1 Tax=Tessaracoccus defluvii TaxID=1285901 RepID=A0A7H0H747_9ACTN|nr:ethanolamine ammonia-lyase subunit EutC [Tessaracoccus defluvii]QNP56363.1 ethanolamine ammonia-lyase subunit EutC [Tessaracoccus defluvii]